MFVLDFLLKSSLPEIVGIFYFYFLRKCEASGLSTVSYVLYRQSPFGESVFGFIHIHIDGLGHKST